MRLSRLLILAVCALGALPARALDPQWLDFYDGPDGLDDRGWRVAAGPDGSVYASGFSYEWVDPTLQVAVWTLTRIAPDGERLWTRRDLSGTSGGGPDALALDGSGNLVVLGTEQPFQAARVSKVSAAGELLWERTLPPVVDFNVEAQAIATGPGDVIYAAWYEYPSIGLAALAKLSPSGDVEWIRTLGEEAGLEGGYPDALAVDPVDGSVYVGGAVALPNRGGDFAVWKYDATGERLWLATDGYAGGATHDLVRDLALRPDGDLVVAGHFGSNTAAGPDVAVARFAPDGTRRWLTLWDGPGAGEDYVYDLALGVAGRIHLAGATDLDPTAYVYGPLALTLSDSGDVLWSRTFSGELPGAFDLFRKVAVDVSGNVFATGGLTEASGAPTYLTVGLESATGGVAWLHALPPADSAGSVARDLTVTSDDAVVVTGDNIRPDGNRDQMVVRFQASMLFAGDFDFGDLGAWGTGGD